MRLVEGVAQVGTGGDGGSGFDGVEALVAELDAIAGAHGVTVQAFDARYVVSRRHLERALELADRERARGDAIARERAVEVLLYAAGRRQIDRALEMGISEGTTPAVVLVDAADGAGGDGDGEAPAAAAVRDLLSPGDTLDDYDASRVRGFYDVGDAELSATDASLADLVLERVALLVVER